MREAHVLVAEAMRLRPLRSAFLFLAQLGLFRAADQPPGDERENPCKGHAAECGNLT